MDVKLIILACLLLLPLAYAGEGRTFELDFNARDQYDLFLKKSDRVLFEYGGYNNTIIIDEIKANATELDIFLFLEKGLHTPDYQFLGKGYEIRLDFNKNGKKEMSIGLIRNNLEDGVTYILLKRLDDWDVVDEKPSNSSYLGYILFGVALIIIISISIFLWNLNKKRGIYF